MSALWVNWVSLVFCGGIFVMMIGLSIDPRLKLLALIPLVGVCVNLACILGAFS